FQSKLAIVLGVFLSHLPGTVNFVSERPVFDVERLFVAVLPPQVGVIGAFFVVAVFNPVPRVVQSAKAGIDANEILGADEAAQLGVFIRAHLVAFDLMRGEVEPRRTLILGADSILPIIAGNKISAWPPDDRNFQAPDQLNEILSESIRVSEW